MDSSQEYESGCDHWIPGPSLQNMHATFTMRIRHWISGFLTHIFLLMTTVLKYINMYIKDHDDWSCKPKLLWTMMVAERLSSNHGKRGDKNQAVRRWVPQYCSCMFLLQYPFVYGVKRWALPLPDHKCNRHVTSSVQYWRRSAKDHRYMTWNNTITLFVRFAYSLMGHYSGKQSWVSPQILKMQNSTMHRIIVHWIQFCFSSNQNWMENHHYIWTGIRFLQACILSYLHRPQKGGEGEGGRCRGSSQFILVHVSKVLLELELHPWACFQSPWACSQVPLIVDQTPSHSSKPWACSYDQVLQTTSLQLFARVHRPLSDHYYSTTLTTFVHQICNKNTIDIHLPRRILPLLLIPVPTGTRQIENSSAVREGSRGWVGVREEGWRFGRGCAWGATANPKN